MVFSFSLFPSELLSFFLSLPQQPAEYNLFRVGSIYTGSMYGASRSLDVVSFPLALLVAWLCLRSWSPVGGRILLVANKLDV